MDSRVRNHAETLIQHSTEVQAGDNVVIDAHPAAEDLVTALHEKLASKGARPLVIQERLGDRFTRAYLRNHSGDFSTPEHVLALYQNMDVYIAIRGSDNVTETGDVDPSTQTEYKKANQPLRDERASKRWCLTQYPASGHAQLAETSTGGYEDFVWDAINKDWSEVKRHQDQLVEILEGADEVHIVSGDTTDITMSVDNNIPENDYGKRNLPGGEVFTAPIKSSVNGTILFDKPLYHEGNEVTDVSLTVEDGKVVEHSASKNEALLEEVLTTDEGASYFGELGIGMNRDIQRYTYNMLFDEKMGDTIHMALGRAYERNVSEENERNQSAIHVDMIVDMSSDSYIEVDDEIVQRDGTFIFEERFN